MAYTVLARRYRSQDFDEVVGQQAYAQTLKNSIRTGRVAHAYLFTGTRGVGKTTMARILAKSLNCLASEGPTTKPCCKCESCIAINLGEDIDVIEIDGASNTGVDNIRELRQNAIYRPARSRYKIYIIDEVHMLSAGAFNALLKILEEPPDHVKFIFATTEPNKVLPTIQSRCQRFDFANISADEIAGQLRKILKKEKTGFEEGVVLAVARLANGSMRDALSLLDQLISTGANPLTADLIEEFLGQPNQEKILELMLRIAEGDAGQTLSGLDGLLRAGQSEVQVAVALTECCRDLMVIKSAGADSDLLIFTEGQKAKMKELSEKFDTAGLVYNITVLEKLRWALRNSDTPRALLEASLMRMTLSEHFMNIDQLMERLDSSGGTGIKKNKIIPERRTQQQPGGQEESEVICEAVFSGPAEFESIQRNWQVIVRQIGKESNNHIGSRLGAARPVSFVNDILTLGFEPSATMAMQLCQSASKSEQIEKLLGKILGRKVKVRFELSSADEKDKVVRPRGAKTSKAEINDIMSDPAVKSLLAGLDGRVIRIGEE
ncbi:MAG: DNA polymerase III subunit gamma/tau [Planctomycetota bacterium]